ncbi:MAG: sulfotransferase [Rhodanobacter sp.]
MSDSTTGIIVSALNAGNWGEAERIARLELAQRPQDGGMQLLLAISLQLQKKLDEAIDIYAALTRMHPESGVHWSNYATALRESGDAAGATQAYATALTWDPKNAQTMLNLGLLQMQQQEIVDARETLLNAHLLDPESIPIRIHAARACSACRDSQVDKLLKPWRTWTMLDSDLELELAYLLMGQGDAGGAETLLDKVLRRVPGQPQALLQLTAVYERMNRLDEARRLLERIAGGPRALDESLRKQVAQQQARLAQRGGDAAAARTLLERTGPIDASDYVHYFALAESCDKLGDTAAAMQALAEAHLRQQAEIQVVAPSHFIAGAAILPAAASRVTTEEFHAWPKLQAPEVGQSPVFIVGFPRSGTTLLEQMLDAHPALQSMDERPFFSTLSDRLAEFDVRVPQDLHKLSQHDCDALRKHYWTLVCEKIPRDWNTQLVDKNPLNMLWVPLINRLFPDAKFILAVRHPCDVILSCYRQNFRSTVLAMACANLERLATAYATAMDHWLHHLAVFEPDVLVSRYEDLVSDLPGHARRIAGFLGIKDAVPLQHFDTHARSKGFIGTPSYDQVIQPLNTRGINRWTRYREELAPVLPIIEPMLRHWHYASEPMAVAADASESKHAV